jgi:branched-chain amino acid transport system ATP-binding protein/urea transport system ATP-binding protein
MRFGGVVVVDNVNFSLGAGELRCLIGPNGAGKSTFFKCLTRQYQPTGGRMMLHGEDITALSTYQIARLGVGIKTQVPSVFDGIPVQENVWVAARQRGDIRGARRRADDTIDRLNLGAIRDKLVGLLSHGQRQWVELAMVVASGPDLILLDEPTAGMTQHEVMLTVDLIREINRNAALIVVEHDMQFIKSIAERVTVFHQGRILVEDGVEAVMANEQVRDVYLGKQQAS